MITSSPAFGGSSAAHFSGMPSRQRIARPAFGQAASIPTAPRHGDRVRFGKGEAIPDCKGARFITTNRYSPNTEWAGAVEDLARRMGGDLSEGRIAHGSQLIERIVQDYRQAVQSGQAAESWGKPRDYVEVIPVNYFNEESKKRGMALWDRAGERLNKRDLPCARFEQRSKKGKVQSMLVKPSWREQACGLEEKTVRYVAGIGGEDVTLMQLQPMFIDGKSELVWVFPETNPAVMRALGELTDQALALKNAPKTPDTLQKAVEQVALIHWLFTVSMPYARGSAGTADILSKVIFDQLGIETGHWRGNFSPDLEAFCMPEAAHFVKAYPNFFTRPPAFKKEAPARSGGLHWVA